MNIILILYLLLLLILFVFYIKYDFANPGFLYLFIWLVAAISSSIYLSGIQISLLTVTIILIGNLIFILGILTSEFFVKSRKNETIENSRISPLLILLLIVFILGGILYIYRDLYSVAASVSSNLNSFSNVLEAARYATTRGISRNSYYSATLLRANFSIGIVVFYYLCKSIFLEQSSRKYKLSLIFISILALGSSILSTGRSELLGMIAGYLQIFLVTYSYAYTWKNVGKRLILLKYIVRVGILFIVLFIFLGTVVLNRTANEGIIGNLIKYMGSSIGTFDYYINNRGSYLNEEFGKHIFVAIYSTLKSLGMYSGDISVHLPFVTINGYRSNVYSVFYFLINDLGYVLGSFLQYFYGFFHGFVYFKIKKSTFSPYYILLLALFSQSLIMSFFAEQFFSTITTHIIRYIFVVILLSLIKFFGRFKLK